MKRLLIVGFIAGLVMAIANFIFDISGIYESVSLLPQVLPMNMQFLAAHNIIFSIMWGIIWIGLYAFFYDYVPNKGVKKGIIYGLIIWIIYVPRLILITSAYGETAVTWSIIFSFRDFISICLIYGPLIGYFYRK